MNARVRRLVSCWAVVVGCLAVSSFGGLQDPGWLFEENLGQADPEMRFVCRDPQSAAGFAREGFLMQLPGSRDVRVRFLDIAPEARLEGRKEARGVLNYLYGSSPSERVTGVRRFAEVRYVGLYRGIDLAYRGEGGRLEYDILVQPGAELAAVRFEYIGAESMRVDPSGDLHVVMPWGEVVEKAPRAYQFRDGRREPVDVAFAVGQGMDVGFRAGAYDRGRELIVDPTLLYSSLFGGTAYDAAHGIAVDHNHFIYVTGGTSSTNFPSINPIYLHGGNEDVFVSKFEPSGTGLVFSTYIGSTEDEIAMALALGPTGCIYLAGTTASTNFPVSPGAFQTGWKGQQDAFVLCLHPSGTSLVYSTYMGGYSNDGAFAIVVDTAGWAYVAGTTESTNFPTVNAFQPGMLPTGPADRWQDAFVAKLAPDGASAAYSTFLGGGDSDGVDFQYLSAPERVNMGIAVDSNGCAHVVGCTVSTNFPLTPNAYQVTNQSLFGPAGVNLYFDAFLTKFSPDGASLEYSTLFGGFYHERAHDVVMLPYSNLVCVVGHTSSTNYPTTADALKKNHLDEGATFDGFMTFFNCAVGTALVYSTYFGGDFGDDQPWAVECDRESNIWVAGYTDATNFPLTNAVQGTIAGETNFLGQYPFDAFASKLTPRGTSLVFSTVHGGEGNDYGHGVAVDVYGAAYVCGRTQSSNFPLKGSFAVTNMMHGDVNQFDAFVVTLAYPLPIPTLDFLRANRHVETTYFAYMGAVYSQETSTNLLDDASWAEVVANASYTGQCRGIILTNLLTNFPEVIRAFRIRAEDP